MFCFPGETFSLQSSAFRFLCTAFFIHLVMVPLSFPCCLSGFSGREVGQEKTLVGSRRMKKGRV